MAAFDFFDAVWCVCHPSHAARWAAMVPRLARLGLGDRVRRFAGLPVRPGTRVGRALAHRSLIQDAAARALRGVLVIEDETLFLDRTEAVLAAALDELRPRGWMLLHLGAPGGSDRLPPVPGCVHLAMPGGAASAHAVAYSHAAYATLLDTLPADFAGMEAALGEDGTIERVLAGLEPSFAVHPAVAAMPPTLPFQAPADQARFVP